MLKQLNTAVFTVKDIATKRRNILFVVHDEDEEWQFLPGTDVDIKDIQVVSLQNILEIDGTISEILNLKYNRYH